VTESSGYVDVTIVKKMVNTELSVGVRTVDSTAKAPSDYTSFDEIVKLIKRDSESTV
jgi:hypothetical protein